MHIKYRSDIDGLRAIAVLSVVLYHTFPKIIQGGFIGVDIFFVISGYLITSIIYTNLNNNSFSFYDFYARRIKRIFPALILVLSTCIAFGWFTLSDKEYLLLGKHSQAGSFFYINFTLLQEIGYFDVSSSTKPLLHLWSLSIEEQFYIIWPFILWFAWKKKLNPISICSAIVLLSFCYNIKITPKYHIDAFYLPIYRAWELMSGSLLAYFSFSNIKIIEDFKTRLDYLLSRIIFANYKSHDGTILRNSASIVGLALAISYIICFKKIEKFPGWYALAPVISSLLILSAGPNAWANKNILSSKILVWVGLISYPLYLWHWPLLSYAYILEDAAPTIAIICYALGLSFLLAWLTCIFIERPIRSSKDKKFIVILLCLCLLIIGCLGNNIYKKKGYQHRHASLVHKEIGVNISDEKDFMAYQQNLEGHKDCLFCNNTENPKFAVVGDSHASSLGYGLIMLAKLDTILLSKGGTLPFINYFTHPPYYSKKEKLQASKYFIDSINKIAKLDSVEYFILLTRGPLYFSGKGFGIEELDPIQMSNWAIEPIKENAAKISSQEAFIEGYVEIINSLIHEGKKVIFVIDFPELGIDPKSCVKKPINISKKSVSTCIIDRKIVDERQKEYRQLIDEIKRRVPSIIIYDPISVFCDSEKCYGKKDNIILYVDDDHLNTRGIKLFTEDFQKWLNKQDPKALQ